MYSCFMMPYLEWSGPLLSTTWMMKYLGLHKTYPTFNICLKAIGAIFFTIGRMGVLNYTYYNACLSRHIHLSYKVYAAVIPLISIYWEFKMIQFVLKAFSPSKESS